MDTDMVTAMEIIMGITRKKKKNLKKEEYFLNEKLK
jgi:hypothetical protein